MKSCGNAVAFLTYMYRYHGVEEGFGKVRGFISCNNVVLGPKTIFLLHGNEASNLSETLFRF